MKIKKKLGEMLVDTGLLTEAQLMLALEGARKANMKLGRFLIRNGIIVESQIVNTIAEQLKIEKYSASKYQIDLDLIKLIPGDFAQQYHVAPIQRKGSLLKIAMLDPLDIYVQDSIEVLTNLETEPVICTERDFNDLLGALYGQHARLGDVIEDMGDMQYEQDEEPEAAPVKDLEVSSLKDLAEEAPVVRLVNSILAQAIRDSASDIHLSPEKDRVNLRFRIDGRLHNVPAPPVRMFLPIISKLKILANMDISISRVPQDGRFTIRMDHHDINIRASSIPTIYGENLVLRLLDTSSGVYSLNELGMSDYDLPKIHSVLNKPYGMILATGPTGSGKSTTLFSIIKEINTPDVNIITLEDPVEYRVEGVRQIQLNRKAGMTFANGLRSILRQDPDVIMVGEIRDGETAEIAVQAALTGHRVFSTVHTNDAAGAITRLLDMGIEPFLASSVLLVSIAQRLVRRICPSCRKPYDPPESALKFFNLEPGPDADYLVGGGCYHCLETGYRGRIGIYEILIIDQAVQELILKKASSRDITRAAVEAGTLHTLKDDAADKIRRGITTFQEAASAIMG